jgi:hypothetical protein
MLKVGQFDPGDRSPNRFLMTPELKDYIANEKEKFFSTQDSWKVKQSFVLNDTLPERTI